MFKKNYATGNLYFTDNIRAFVTNSMSGYHLFFEEHGWSLKGLICVLIYNISFVKLQEGIVLSSPSSAPTPNTSDSRLSPQWLSYWGAL